MTEVTEVVEQVEEAGVVTTPLVGLRRTAARRMVKAWEAPVFHLGVDVDMTAALARKGSGITVSDVLLLACATALRAHPRLNAWYGDEAVTVVDDINIGLAVATDAGLVVPVVHRVGALDLEGVAAARRDVVERARIGKLAMVDVTKDNKPLPITSPNRFDSLLTVTVKITNTGTFVGTEIVQLYMSYPDTWGEPLRLLKGITNISLQPQESSEVKFNLSSQDLSVWDKDSHQWSLPCSYKEVNNYITYVRKDYTKEYTSVFDDDCIFNFFVGTSSRDFRQEGSIQIKN